MPRLIDADALIQAMEDALAVAQKAGDTREIIKHNMLLCALREAETVDPIRAAGGCYCWECKHQHYDADYGKRWCKRDIGCREVRADGIGFCGDGEPRETRDDGL